MIPELVKVNEFAQICLMWEVKFGEDPFDN